MFLALVSPGKPALPEEVTDVYRFWEYGLYFGIAVLVTILVGRVLFRSGRPFLLEAFHGDVTMAESVNNLLIIGFYLVNTGFMLLFLSSGAAPERALTVVEHLSWKLGVVIIVLGGMHFFNLIVLNVLRGRGRAAAVPPLPKA